MEGFVREGIQFIRSERGEMHTEPRSISRLWQVRRSPKFVASSERRLAWILEMQAQVDAAQETQIHSAS
jgi:hypothetical protein